jgi:hypothetical protein
LGCMNQAREVDFLTSCVDLNQYKRSSAVYSFDSNVLTWYAARARYYHAYEDAYGPSSTNSARPYCATARFLDANVYDYECDSVSYSAPLTYYTDYDDGASSRTFYEYDVTLISSTTISTSISTSIGTSIGTSTSTHLSSSSSPTITSGPTPNPIPSPTPKSHTAVIAGSVVGGLVILGSLIAGTIVYLRRRKQREVESPPEVSQM